jgi:hypothetical protein
MRSPRVLAIRPSSGGRCLQRPLRSERRPRANQRLVAAARLSLRRVSAQESAGPACIGTSEASRVRRPRGFLFCALRASVTENIAAACRVSASRKRLTNAVVPRRGLAQVEGNSRQIKRLAPARDSAVYQRRVPLSRLGMAPAESTGSCSEGERSQVTAVFRVGPRLGYVGRFTSKDTEALRDDQSLINLR